MILKDGIRSHPKMLKVGLEAAWLWVCAIDYSRDQLLDGFVPADALSTLARFTKKNEKPEQLAQRLCDARLFEAVDGGYKVHDFLSHNDSAETVRTKRARDVERKRNPNGTNVDSTRIPSGEKDARAGARERVGVCTGIGSGSGSGSSDLKEHDPAPRVDPLSPSLWDIWRETGEAHGYPQGAIARGSNLQANIAAIRGLVRDDAELRAALATWWPSPTPRDDQRTLGHFAGNLPSVLKHVRSGGSGPWGVTQAATADDRATAAFNARWGATAEARS